jgi:maltose/moltooligosaccharide transporter
MQWKKIFLIGFGFFTITLAWAVYNTYVPVFLEKLIKSSTIIGLIMTIDNFFGIILQPFFGNLSDKTNNKFGRRMPYLIIGIPLSALFFIFIPMHTGILMLILSVMGMNLFMSIYRSPAVALMPDSTPPHFRSKANGVINFMGGIGAVVALYIGGKLYKLDQNYPFIMVAVLMIAALIILLVFFREPKKSLSGEIKDDEKKLPLINLKNPEESLLGHNSSLILMLVSIFFWFCGYFSLESFFSLYGKDVLGIEAGISSQILAITAGTLLLSAIPAGFIGTRFGRKKTILTGLILMILSFLIISLFPSILIIKVMFIISGSSWALININSYPAVLAMAPEGHAGKYTGYYYTFSFAASILSPILFGFISDLTGNYKMLFIFSCAAFFIALCFFIPTKGLEKLSADE